MGFATTSLRVRHAKALGRGSGTSDAAPLDVQQRRRQSTRFPYRQHVWLKRDADAEPLCVEARNITTRGIFIATEVLAELQSEVELSLIGIDGSRVAVRARVMRRSLPPGTQRAPEEPGFGLSFENLDEPQQRAIAAIVEVARQNDSRKRIPRMMQVLGARPLVDPLLAFVAKHIDGRRAPEELASRVGLDLDAVVELIHELCELGAAELCPLAAAGDGTAAPNHLDRLSARGSGEHPPLATVVDAELRAELDARLACRDHYELLSVDQDATRDQLRAAFLALSTRFDPGLPAMADSAFADKAARLMQRVANAYATLANSETRAGYDAYRARARLIRAVENPETNHPATSDELTRLHEAQARYEERHEEWERAGASWTRVYEGRPDDAVCAHRAARALLEAKLELRRAQSFAERAIALEPSEPVHHRLLARIFLETGLRLRAKKELQLAAALLRKQQRVSRRISSGV